MLHFAGFYARDWDRFEAEGKPKPKRAWELHTAPAPTAKPAPIQIEVRDKDLFQNLERFARIDRGARLTSPGPKVHVLEWKLKARIMQLNRWADGTNPLPHTSALGKKLDGVRNQHAAKKLFDTVGRSNAYFPSQWLFFHLNKLAANYGIDAKKYFTR